MSWILCFSWKQDNFAWMLAFKLQLRTWFMWTKDQKFLRVTNVLNSFPTHSSLKVYPFKKLALMSLQYLFYLMAMSAFALELTHSKNDCTGGKFQRVIMFYSCTQGLWRYVRCFSVTYTSFLCIPPSNIKCQPGLLSWHPAPFVIVQLHSHVRLFVTHSLQHARPPCPSPSPRVCRSSRSLLWRCCPAISSSDTLFCFCPQSFPASETFQMSRLFISDNQNTGASASASVLPVNIQGWSPLKLIVLISLLSKGFSGIFSRITVRRHKFFGILPSLQSSSHNRLWPPGRP